MRYFLTGDLPRIPGHEVSGGVVAKGQQVPEAIREGDRVMLSPYSHCGLCPACRAGRPNCCRFNQTLGLQGDGAMTGKFAIHYSKVFPSKVLSLVIATDLDSKANDPKLAPKLKYTRNDLFLASIRHLC